MEKKATLKEQKETLEREKKVSSIPYGSKTSQTTL